ncbi:glycosyltransferase [Alicyclobacillus sp.]|uniref:glycosyltransferase family 4 protein n=1 Tax=Alicyclobacillus sp. TaxID=61169 RepID=UPI0025BB6EF9|nr:glycosyltransferase [Alicyclobacillus sp.]MCL6516403.1 glycosyltransferase [Alicyclobacillus sp.]
MHILHVIHRLWPGGGTETHVLTLARTLAAQGNTVSVFTAGGPWTAHLRRLEIPVVTGPWRISALRQTIRALGADVVHVHDTPGYRLAAALGGTTRVIVTVHGLYAQPAALRRVARRAHAVIAVSPAAGRYAVGVGVHPGKVVVIPNGVPPCRAGAVRRSKGRFVIGYAGRFTLGKRALGLRVIRAAARFAARHQDVTVLVAGHGSPSAVTRYPGVRVLGHLDDLALFYRSCDLVIGTGRVAMEAIRCGVPVLAIGMGGYLGLITRRNFRRALRTNFGDHAVPRIPWTAARLHDDLGRCRAHLDDLRREAQHLRRIAGGAISSATMARRTLRLYRGDLPGAGLR